MNSSLFHSYIHHQLLDFSRASGLETYLSQPRTSNEVSERFEWDASAAGRYLNALAACGAVRVEETSGTPVFSTASGPQTRRGQLELEFFGWLNQPGQTFPSESAVEDFSGQKLLSEFKSAGMPELADASWADLVTVSYYRNVISKFLQGDVLDSALRSSSSQARLALGIKSSQIFDHYSSNAALLRTYSLAFAAMNAEHNSKAIQDLPLRPGQRVLDVGGGSGDLAARILAQFHCEVEVHVYDLPATAEALKVNRAFFTRSLSRHPEWRYGDFFGPDTCGLQGIDASEKFDVITLGWILHDWQDDRCVEILSRVRDHLQPNGVVAILEKVLDPQASGPIAVIDFVMLLMADGKERRLVDYDKLLHTAGLQRSACNSYPKGRDLILARSVEARE